MANSKNTWDRDQVTFRLTERRKSLLTAFAASESVSGSPSDAIDRALELAVAHGAEQGSGLLDRIDAIEEALEASAMARRRESDELRAELAGAREALARLADLLTDLAAE